MKAFRFGERATRQRELISLLVSSPLPWNMEMLCSWFDKQPNQMSSVYEAVHLGRVWRCGYGLFTAIERKPSPRLYHGKITYSSEDVENVVNGPRITDDMLARFGYNL